MDARYIYYLALISTLVLVLLPIIVQDANGGIPDKEPYGVLKLVVDVIDLHMVVIVGTIKLSIPNDDIDAKLDTFREDFKTWMTNKARIYSLMPVWLFIVIFIPLVIAALVTLIDLLPFT